MEDCRSGLPTDVVPCVHSQVIPLIPITTRHTFAHSIFIRPSHSHELLKHSGDIVDLIAGAHCSQPLSNLCDLVGPLLDVCEFHNYILRKSKPASA
jgi:hypothetical protein